MLVVVAVYLSTTNIKLNEVDQLCLILLVGSGTKSREAILKPRKLRFVMIVSA